MSDPWEAHEIEQLKAWLALTPAQRIAWLEGAKRFARLAQQARNK